MEGEVFSILGKRGKKLRIDGFGGKFRRGVDLVGVS